MPVYSLNLPEALKLVNNKLFGDNTDGVGLVNDLKNNYKIGGETDYSNQKLSAIANLKLNTITKLLISMLANFENSDSEYHKFNRLLPSISYQRKIGDKRTNLKFRFESLVFEDLELRDYNRLVLSYLVKNRDINKRKTTNLSVNSKSLKLSINNLFSSS